MKKLLVLVMSLVLLFTLVACSSGDDVGAASSMANEEASSVAQAESQAVAESTPQAEEAVPMTLEEYVVIINEENAQQFADLEEQGIIADVLARDNSMVFTYKFSIDVGDIDTAKTTIEADLESNASFFESSYSMMKTEISELEAVVVEYYTMDDELIISRDFN